MGNEAVVSVGFPQTLLPSLERLMHREDVSQPVTADHVQSLLTFSALCEVNEKEFLDWKGQLIKESFDAVEQKIGQNGQPGSLSTIVERILSFQLEKSTPVECLLFVSELKSLAVQAYGPLR